MAFRKFSLLKLFTVKRSHIFTFLEQCLKYTYWVEQNKNLYKYSAGVLLFPPMPRKPEKIHFTFHLEGQHQRN